MIAFSCFSQGSDSTVNDNYKPYFYGEIQDSNVYCFTITQTKNIAKEIVTSIQSEVNDSLYKTQIENMDSVISNLKLNLSLNDTLLANYDKINRTNEGVIFMLENDGAEKDKYIAAQNKEIKKLKTQRLVYPAAVAIIFLILFAQGH